MGNAVCKRLFGSREVRILFLGLDAAGKTTALYQMKLGELVTTIPTIGFNVETIEHRNVKITAWDVGGRDKIRPLYRHYFSNTDGLVFVIDSDDRDRFEDAMDEIKRTVGEDELRDAPVLILANKQDLEHAMKPEEICRRIQDAGFLRAHTWTVFGVQATNGDGLFDGLTWLTDSITLNQKNKLYEKLTDQPAKGVAVKEDSKDSNNNTKKEVSKVTYLSDIALSIKHMIVGK